MCRAGLVPGRGIYLGRCWRVDRQGTIHRHAPGAGLLLASLLATHRRTILSTVATRDQPRPHYCRAVSHRCCVSGVRGPSDRVIKRGHGSRLDTEKLRGGRVLVPVLEWCCLCPLLCSRLWKSRASVWDGEPQRPAPHRRTAGPAPGGPGLLLLPTSLQLISLKCILGSRQ